MCDGDWGVSCASCVMGLGCILCDGDWGVSCVMGTGVYRV